MLQVLYHVHHTICVNQASKQLPFEEERKEETGITRSFRGKVKEKNRELEKENRQIIEGIETSGASATPSPLLQLMWRGISKLQQEERSSEAMQTLAETIRND